MIRTPVGVPFKIWLTIRYHEEMGARPTKSYDYTNTSTPGMIQSTHINLGYNYTYDILIILVSHLPLCYLLTICIGILT